MAKVLALFRKKKPQSSKESSPKTRKKRAGSSPIPPRHKISVSADCDHAQRHGFSFSFSLGVVRSDSLVHGNETSVQGPTHSVLEWDNSWYSKVQLMVCWNGITAGAWVYTKESDSCIVFDSDK